MYLRFVYSQDNQYPYYNAYTVPPEWHGWLSHVDDGLWVGTPTTPGVDTISVTADDGTERVTARISLEVDL